MDSNEQTYNLDMLSKTVENELDRVKSILQLFRYDRSFMSATIVYLMLRLGIDEFAITKNNVMDNSDFGLHVLPDADGEKVNFTLLYPVSDEVKQ